MAPDDVDFEVVPLVKYYFADVILRAVVRVGHPAYGRVVESVITVSQETEVRPRRAAAAQA